MSQSLETLLSSPLDTSLLPDYPFESHFVKIDSNLTMHYVDEGDPEDPIVLLLHGEPNWSFVYRSMIPPLAEAGYRVIAPDLIGFGRSDKLKNAEDYTYTSATDWLTSFVHQLNLRNIRLFAHDWGGMIALRIIAHEPDLFSRVIISYAFLFTGEEPVPKSFVDWKNYAQNNPNLRASQVMDWGTNRALATDQIQAYDAPFPTEAHLQGVRKFPSLIPTEVDSPEAATNRRLREQLKTFGKPFLTVWGNQDDPMWQGKDKILQAEIPGAWGQNHRILVSNHFVQEDQPQQLVKIMLAFFAE